MQLTQEQIRVAVEWWCEVLKAPKFDNLGPTVGQNAEETRVNLIASILASECHKVPSEEALQSFAAALTDALGGVGDVSPYFGLHCDYDPDQILANAAAAAGLEEPSVFPWKTHMSFEQGGVQVSYGYRAPRAHLLAGREEREGTDAT